jgi:hypothetical protein
MLIYEIYITIMPKRKISATIKDISNIRNFIHMISTAYLLYFNPPKEESLEQDFLEQIEAFVFTWNFDKPVLEQIINTYQLDEQDLRSLVTWHHIYQDISNLDEQGNDFLYYLLSKPHDNIMNLWKFLVDNDVAPHFNQTPKNQKGLKLLRKKAPTDTTYQKMLDYVEFAKSANDQGLTAVTQESDDFSLAFLDTLYLEELLPPPTFVQQSLPSFSLNSESNFSANHFENSPADNFFDANMPILGSVQSI